MPIFSEYGEGSSFNKWVEIYNPTSQNISLDDFRYNFCWNGCDSLEWEFSLAFDTGYILMPGETYLLVHYDADSVLLDASNQTTNILSNGNDVVGLHYIPLTTIVDIIGVFDSVNVSVGWDVDGVINATQNHTMRRDFNVCSGNMGNWNLSNGSSTVSEWTVDVIDNFDDLNAHNSNCINTSSIEVSENHVRTLLEIRDILGRKTSQYKDAFFYIYDDGTVEKKTIIK